MVKTPKTSHRDKKIALTEKKSDGHAGMAYLSAINNAPHNARPEFGEEITL
jgi:hypothetical protein